LSQLEKVKSISEIVTGVLWAIYIVVILAQTFGWFPPSTGSQITIPPEVNWLIFIILTIVIIVVLANFWKWHSIKRIDHVCAYIFFPIGTLRENKTLGYHKEHYQKRLIVNFKTKIPQAYPLPNAPTCYGWRMIHKYADMWFSFEDSIYPNPDNQRWCDEKSYHLNPYSASKEELLKTDALNAEPSTTDISIVKTRSLFSDSKLMEAYSPIHAMITRINRVIPRESALQWTVGMPVKASLIDFDSIRKVFEQHNDKLRKKDLDMWVEIEEEIEARNYFFLGKDRQAWFDELEAKYNQLTKHQKVK